MTAAPDHAAATAFDAIVIGAGVGGLYALHRLRDKLGDDAERPRYVATVRGVGYCLRAES